MKRILTFLFFSLLLTSVTFAQEKAEEDKFLEDYNSQVIQPQVEAWLELANVYLPPNPDIVSIWTHTTLESITNKIHESKIKSVYEQRALLSELQNILCCGITYPYAWIDYNIAPHPSKAGREMLKESNNYINYLSECGFKNGVMVSKYEGMTYLNFTIYMILNAISREGDYEVFNSLVEETKQATQFIVMLFNATKNEIQAFYYSTLINNLTFFKTFNMLIRCTGANDFYKERKDIYEKISLFFDKQADKILIPIYGNQSETLPHITSDEFLEMEKTASEYKIIMVNDLAEALNLAKDKILNQ